jgi:hypothetical protein
VAATPDQIVALVEANARKPLDVGYLVAWVGWRAGTGTLPMSLEPIERLRYACRFWLDQDERDKLFAWLERRVEAGQSLIPRFPGQPQ